MPADRLYIDLGIDARPHARVGHGSSKSPSTESPDGPAAPAVEPRALRRTQSRLGSATPRSSPSPRRHVEQPAECEAESAEAQAELGHEENLIRTSQTSGRKSRLCSSNSKGSRNNGVALTKRILDLDSFRTQAFLSYIHPDSVLATHLLWPAATFPNRIGKMLCDFCDCERLGRGNVNIRVMSNSVPQDPNVFQSLQFIVGK